MLRLLLLLLLFCFFIAPASAALPAGFELAAENADLELYVNYQTAETAVRAKADHTIWYSNPPARATEETIARGVTLERLQAQIAISYYGPDDRQRFMNSFTHSVQHGQFMITEQPNGLRVDYYLKEDWSDKAIPRIIGADRFETAVLSGLSRTSDQQLLRNLYAAVTLIEKEPDYERITVTTTSSSRYHVQTGPLEVDKDAVFGNYRLQFADEDTLSEDDRRELISLVMDLYAGAETLGAQIEGTFAASRAGEIGLGVDWAAQRHDRRPEDFLPLLDNPALVLRRGLVRWDMTDLMELIGQSGYTAREAQADHNAYGLTQFDPVRVFHIPLEYELDGAALRVRIPLDEVAYPTGVPPAPGQDRAEYAFQTGGSAGRVLAVQMGELFGLLGEETVDYPLHSITVLEFFGAAGPDQEGFFVLPDGCGALVPFNSGRTYVSAYNQPIYGRDHALMPREQQRVPLQPIHLPVFGIQHERAAVLAIITRGDAIGRIRADIAGRLNSYNTCFAEFVTIPKGDMVVEESRQLKLNTYQDRLTADAIELRYAFLYDEAADYIGMAHYYQDYLQQKHGLTSRTQPASFFLTLVGAIPVETSVVGLPRTVLEPLTRLSEASAIVRQLQAVSVAPLNLRFSGWLQGGLEHRLPLAVKVEPAVGTAAELSELAAAAAAGGGELYPDLHLLSVFRHSLLDRFSPRNDASRFLNRQPAVFYDYHLATYQAEPAGYILSPARLPWLIDHFLANYAKLNLTGLALSDLGWQLSGDYREGEQLVDRQQAQTAITGQAERLAAGLNLLVKQPHAYVLPYADVLIDVPYTSSGHSLSDYAIPFYQIVTRGLWDYAGPPLNLAHDYADAVLRMFEFGGFPHFTWTARPSAATKETDFHSYFSTYYRDWLSEAAALYAAAEPIYAATAGERIVGHSSEDGMAETVFANDYRIRVDYHNHTVKLLHDGIVLATLDITGQEREGLSR